MFGRIAYISLVASLTFVFGLAIGAVYEPVGRFLDEQIANIKEFAAGHPLEEKTTAIQKIQNDLGLAPWRSTRKQEIPTSFDYKVVKLADGVPGIFPDTELSLFVKKDSPALSGLSGMLIKTQVNDGNGYSDQLLLVGLDGFVYKNIVLGSEKTCNCSATNALNYFHVSGNPASSRKKGNSLINVNSCGHIDWQTKSKYMFHHYLNNDGDHNHDSFWILDATDLVQIDSKTGNITNRISLSEIINANPDLHIFEPRLHRSRWDRWLYNETEFTPLNRTHARVTHADVDPFHTNDIDEYLGEQSDLFKKGDLVLSFRSLNLLAVIRPSTKKIIWYSFGLTSRQHDPDFTSQNSIIVYDNNFHNKFSRIVELKGTSDLEESKSFNFQRKILVENFENNIFSQTTGGTQFFVNGDKYIIFEANYYSVGVDLNDKTVFLAVRHKWQEKEYLKLEIERMLSQDEFNDIKHSKCNP